MKTILDNYSVQLYSLKLDTDDFVQCLTAVEEFLSDWTEVTRVLLWIVEAFKSNRCDERLKAVNELFRISMISLFQPLAFCQQLFDTIEAFPSGDKQREYLLPLLEALVRSYSQ